MHKASWNQVRLKLRLRPLTPLLIKSGDKGASLLHPERPDMMCVRTRRGSEDTVYIPGASLKGVLRSTSERILRTLHPSWSCDPLNQKTPCVNLQREQDAARVYQGQCRACRTYGSQALAARALFADAYPHDAPTLAQANQTEVRSGVAIDRKTGGPSSGKLYEFEVVTGGSFDTEIVLRNYELWQLGLLCLSVQELGDGFVRLGSARSRGLGRVAVDWQEVLLDQTRAGAGRIAGVGALAPSWQAEYGLLAQDDRLAEGPKASPGPLGQRFKLGPKEIGALLEQLLGTPWAQFAGSADAAR